MKSRSHVEHQMLTKCSAIKKKEKFERIPIIFQINLDRAMDKFSTINDFQFSEKENTAKNLLPKKNQFKVFRLMSKPDFHDNI